MIGAGFLVAGSGYIVGAFLAWGTGLSVPEITAVAIETSFQNGVIALVILKLSLEEPLGELASLAPLAQMCVTGLPLWALLAIIKIHQRCKKKSETGQRYSEVPGADKQIQTS